MKTIAIAKNTNQLFEMAGVALVMIAWVLLAVNQLVPAFITQCVASSVWIVWAMRQKFNYLAGLNLFLFGAAVIGIVNQF